MEREANVPAFTFGWMSADIAAEIMKWQYPPPYSVYSMSGGEEELAELMNGTYYYALSGDGEIAGYFCVGGSARVPGGFAVGLYADEFCLDIGLGLRPDMTGRGLGACFVKQVMAFVEEEFRPRRLQLVVAAYNIRAVRAYLKAGFYEIGQFQSMLGNEWVPFIAMRCHLRQPTLVTERLRLRPMTEADAGDLVELAKQDDRAGRSLGELEDVSGGRLLIRAWKHRHYTLRQLQWGITRQSANAVIGWVGLNDLDPERERAELDLYLSPAFRGAAYGRESLRAVAWYGLEQLRLGRIQAAAEPGDEGYRRLLEATGFKPDKKPQDHSLREDEPGAGGLYILRKCDTAGMNDWASACGVVY
ncbi:GNAT family N-acetyltransferase [Paenibacillus thailandensis]|uniref:GNAT family N-acetyltransferase n=1 Tax=Paenibacillus thailandensis TaxID=393250 RepID=A0ABW5QTT1_9BACL